MSNPITFGSEDWFRELSSAVLAALGTVDLTGCSFSVMEVYRNPPADLQRDDGTDLGWHCRCEDGVVSFSREPLVSATSMAAVDFDLAERLAALDTAALSPAESRALEELMGEAIASGAIARHGGLAAAGFETAAQALASVHDRMARLLAERKAPHVDGA